MICIEVVVVVTWLRRYLLRTTSERRSFLSGRSYAQKTKMYQEFEDEGSYWQQSPVSGVWGLTPSGIVYVARPTVYLAGVLNFLSSGWVTSLLPGAARWKGCVHGERHGLSESTQLEPQQRLISLFLIM